MLKSNNLKSILFSLLMAVVGFYTATMLISSKPTDDQLLLENIRSNYRIYAIPLPRQLNFAGEEAPILDYEVRERIDKEILTNTYWQSNTLMFFKRAFRHFGVIEQILIEEGVPTDFKYLAVAESGLQNVVSPAGAAGYWQFMKQTGIQYGLMITDEIDERYHLEKSTRAACKYLKESYSKFGSWSMVAAAYNMGNGGLQKQADNQTDNNYYNLFLNTETSRYLPRILAIKAIMEQPALYGFQFRPVDMYQPIIVKKLIVNQEIKDLSQFAKDNGTNYKHLKLLNPWLRKSFLPNKQGLTYEIAIPENTQFQPINNWPKGFTHWAQASTLKSVSNADDNSSIQNHINRKAKTIKHTVLTNETLPTIATQYQTSVSNIIHANNLQTNQLKKGQILVIEVP